MTTVPGSTDPLDDGPIPATGGSTTAQLKADLSGSQRTTNILDSDHGLSQLGTDDEAGGSSPSPALVDQMRQLEAEQQPPGTSTPPGMHDQSPRPVPIALLLTIGVVVALVALWFFLLGGF